MTVAKTIPLCVIFQLACGASALAVDTSDSKLSSKIEEAIKAYARTHSVRQASPADLKAFADIAAAVAARSHERPRPSAGAAKSPTRASSVQVSNLEPTTAASANPQPPASPKFSVIPPPFQFVVRKDFANTGVIAAGALAGKGTGATFSYASDRVAKNGSWTAQGVGIVAYHLDDCAIDPLATTVRPYCAQIGIYGGIDKITNTSRSTSIATSPGYQKSKDSVIWGGFVETGVQRTVDYLDFFRFKAGGVTNNAAERTLFSFNKTTITTTQAATQFSMTGEWIPTYDFSHIPGLSPLGFNKEMQIGGGPIMYFIPELYLQYDNTLDSTKLISFSNKSRALRFGPQLGLFIAPFPFETNLNLQRISIYAVYHYFHEFVSNKNNYALQTNLNYKITDGLGFTIQYQRGVNENTGRNVNLFTVGISASLCGGVSCDSGS
jgi:hypothetical protein